MSSSNITWGQNISITNYIIFHLRKIRFFKIENKIYFDIFLSESIDTESKHPQKPNTVTVNCTVAYMAQCSSWNKCKASCQSMGATSFRWFHDGCCECIGNTCINYGINESRCLHCPLDKEDDDLKDQYDDYGQEEELNEDELD